jgi:hypothetical protein
VIVLNINEFTIWRFFVQVLFRREIYILKVQPFFPPIKQLLQPVVNWSLKTGRAQKLIDCFPSLISDWENPDEGMRHDTFRKIEPWQDNAFCFEQFTDLDPYGRAYKHLVCNYLWNNYPLIFPLNALFKNPAYEKCKIFGISKDVIGILGAYFGRKIETNIQPERIPNRFLNSFISVIITLYAIAWILTRVRPFVKPQDVYFGADFQGDYRDEILYNELKDVAPLLIIPRFTHIPESWKSTLKGKTICMPNKGAFTPLAALKAMLMVIRDGFSLYLRHRDRYPRLFYDIASLPYRRALIQGVFNYFHPQYFYGRDDYQVEHILRYQELKKIGGKSIGINHGISAICHLIPAWRYIQFDTYFVHGQRLSDLQKGKWAPEMKILPVGGFGFSREQLTKTRVPSKIILFMIRYFINNPEFVSMISAVAKEFPEYTIQLQVKRGYAHDRYISALRDAVTQKFPNVVYTTVNVYELIPKAAYVLADASTVVAEAIQLDIPTQMLDVLPEHETCVYRQFPDLCRTNTKDLVDTLKALESGKKTFSRNAFEELVDVSDNIIFDQIRQEIGLSPKKERCPK